MIYLQAEKPFLLSNVTPSFCLQMSELTFPDYVRIHVYKISLSNLTLSAEF